MRLILPAVLLLVSVAACSTSPPTVENLASDIEFRNVGLDVDFVGDAVCFDCHESQWEGFQTHAMSQSFYEMTPENQVEDYNVGPVYHERSDLYYQPLRRGDEFFQEEFRLDDDGTKIHSLVRKINFVLGSGNAARTYVTENNGRLHELPLTWFSQGTGWAMSPGYERENVRFDRILTDRCMSCHNSYPEEVPFVAGKYASVPEGISCERCHGPGALHVDERLAEFSPPDSIDTSIVNPAHLTASGQLDVCQQCHTTGAVTVLKGGKGDFDFRPGQALTSHITIFEERTPDSGDGIVVVSHAERLKSSACYLETQASTEPLTCVTCHNPHEGFRDKGPEYFNTTCISCHADLNDQFDTEPLLSDHSGVVSCASCHMPRVEAQNAPHASFTDHWIRSTSNTPTDPSDPILAPELVPLADAGPTGSLELGMAYLIHGEQKAGNPSIQRGISILDTTLVRDPEYADAQFLYGRALVQAGRVPEAIIALEKARELEPDNPEFIQELARVYEIDDRPQLVSEQLYREALSIQPENAEIRVLLAQLLESEGRLDAARNEYKLAIESDPWLKSAHYGLGTASLTLQQIDDAEAAFGTAIELDPDFANALANLGAVKILKQELTEAADLFERAVTIEPTNVAAAGNLGLVYAQLGEYAKARDRLQQVLILSPGDERARAALEEVRRLMRQ